MKIDKIDITGHIGDLYSTPRKNIKWPMYSYSRPSWILWGAIADALFEKGWTEEEVKEWLQSKETRWALDFELGNRLRELGKQYAERAEKVSS